MERKYAVNKRRQVDLQSAPRETPVARRTLGAPSHSRLEGRSHVTLPAPSRPLHSGPPLADDLRLAGRRRRLRRPRQLPSAAPPRTTGTSPARRAQTGIDQLREHTPRRGQRQRPGRRARPATGHPLDASVIDPLTERLGAMDHAVSVSPPRLSADKDTALLDGAVRRAGHPPGPDGRTWRRSTRPSTRLGRRLSRSSSAATCPTPPPRRCGAAVSWSASGPPC